MDKAVETLKAGKPTTVRHLHGKYAPIDLPGVETIAVEPLQGVDLSKGMYVLARVDQRNVIGQVRELRSYGYLLGTSEGVPFAWVSRRNILGHIPSWEDSPEGLTL